jgi:hypothetical protein
MWIIDENVKKAGATKKSLIEVLLFSDFNSVGVFDA